MIFCHQKYKHCFVACCASALGKSDIKSQEDIVAQFSTELQKGEADEGVPKTSVDIAKVVVGLGLSKQPQLVISNVSTYDCITGFLKGKKGEEEKIFYFTRHPTNHSMRIKEVRDDGVWVMNPEEQDFTFIKWPDFEASKPTLLLL